MAALGFGMSGFGLVLVWAGVKGEDLRTVMADVFTGKRRFVGADRRAGKATPEEVAAKAVAAARKAGSTAAALPPGTVTK